MSPIDKLKTVNLELPAIFTLGSSYRSVNERANTSYIAIQFPILNEDL